MAKENTCRIGLKSWGEPQKNLNTYCQVKQAILKTYIPQDFNYITFWKTQNYGDSNYGEQWQLEIGGGWGWYLEEGRDEQVEPGDFQDSATILYDTIMMDTCHYTFLKTHRRQKNPNGISTLVHQL